MAATALLAAPGTASAGIDFPADGHAYKTSPADFHGDASLNFFRFVPSVRLSLYRIQQNWHSCVPAPNPCPMPEAGPYDGFSFPAGSGEDNLDIDGDWHIPFGSVTDRTTGFDPNAPYVPDGTPLEDGKYHVNVKQLDHTVGLLDVDSPDHNRWGSTFWIDSKDPDTVISSAEPAQPFAPGPREFRYYAADQKPGSPTKLECRIDGGPWFGGEDILEQPQLAQCGSDLDAPADLAGKASHYTVDAQSEGRHTFEVRTTDLAGNVDPTPAIHTWWIDKTKPEISIAKPAMRERYVLDQHVPADFGCTDPLAGDPPFASGVVSCEGPATVDTSKLGNFTYTVTAEDAAGNTHSVIHSYAVDPPRYADVIGANHPIAYYRMNEALGSAPMLDRSGNHHDGEYENGIALKRPPAPSCHVRPHAPYTCDLTADPQDWAAFFPARDGYGFANGIAAPRTGYTLEAWINRADTGDGSIVGQGGGGQLFVEDGRLALRQTQDTVRAEGPVLEPGRWWHVAATWNGSTTRLYVNGALVGQSGSANKAPSGSATLYVGYGDQAPWFHGSLDEAAYYGSALSPAAIEKRFVVGTAMDVPGPVGGPPIQRPSADIHSPANNGLYAPGKAPSLLFHCEDLDGDGTVASCTATVDGQPAAHGDPLPDSPGSHTVVVTAVDEDELTRSHTHTYKVMGFADIYRADSPVAYYRLGDANGEPMRDSGPQHRDGTYKNAQESGPVGISGDGDHARRFFGSGGYGFVPSIPAPRHSSTIEAWVDPDDGRDQSVVGHGDAGEIFVEGGRFKFRHMGTTVTAATGPQPGRFTQVVGVWDGVTISVYVDGELSGRAEATKRPSSASTFYVGFGEIEPWFEGRLDEVAYYGSALPPERILQHFLADPPPDGDTPVVDPDPNPAVDLPDPPPAPSTGPGSSSPSGGEAGGSSAAGSGKAAAKRKGAAKCKKLKKPAKRKKCLKRASRN